ncbi:hypothetical protein ABIF66_001334 [Bradyrhizobium japonicum]
MLQRVVRFRFGEQGQTETLDVFFLTQVLSDRIEQQLCCLQIEVVFVVILSLVIIIVRAMAESG